MTANEFAFLALGLVLGVATGSALVVVLGSRPPAREVRLTVERGAVPRRAATLSTFSTAPGEPARGGPADRRRLDRDAPVADPPPRSPFALPAVPSLPVMDSAGGPAAPVTAPVAASPMRTTVPSAVRMAPAPVPLDGPTTAGPAATGAIEVVPDRDPALDDLRVQAVLGAELAQAAGQRTPIGVMDPPPAADPPADEAGPAGMSSLADATPAIIRILRGDHRALIRTVEILAGADQAMRRPWQAAVGGLAEMVIRRAIRFGVLDFPVGNPFWDTFTTDQCRAIAAALAATGFRFDGIDGWEDERVPGYRDLTAAVAAAGLEPRRIRAWPTQDEIAALFRDVTVAADEHFLAHAPEFELSEVRALVGTAEADLDLLWRHWALARPVLGAPIAAD